MKKPTISSILAFFGILKKEDTRPRDNQQETLEPMPKGVEYDVLLKGEYLSTERNLMEVAKKYTDLKRSTLYKAFAKADNTSRTYEKNNYVVEECQKF